MQYRMANSRVWIATFHHDKDSTINDFLGSPNIVVLDIKTAGVGQLHWITIIYTLEEEGTK